MPRRPRIHIDGVPLHIVQRGHNREACFFDDQDRHAYLGWLRDALKRENCQLHAYVLMTNHVHLLLTPACAPSVPRLIISVGRRFVQYINHAYGRTGTLWDSRFYAQIEAMTGQRCELRKRGRPRKKTETESPVNAPQQKLPV